MKKRFLLLCALLAAAVAGWGQCLAPAGLRATQVNAIDAFLAWDGQGAAQFELYYGPQGASLDSMAQLALTDSSAHLAGLARDTEYEVRLRAICGAGDTSAFATLTFTTRWAAPEAQLPYRQDFSNGLDDWRIESLGGANQWVLDTLALYHRGDACLYICDTAFGRSHSYGYPASHSVAWREFELPAGRISYSFDWLCRGWRNIAGLTVSLLPDGGQEEDAILLGESMMSENPSWMQQAGEVVIPQAGVYRLRFDWSNISYTCIQPPAAVDNIILTSSSCPLPQGVTVEASANSITLNWLNDTNVWAWEAFCNGDTVSPGDTTHTFTNLALGEEYVVGVRSQCEHESSFYIMRRVRTGCYKIGLDGLPYEEDFNSWGTDNYPIPMCWRKTGWNNSLGIDPSLALKFASTFHDSPRAVLPEVDTASVPLSRLTLSFTGWSPPNLPGEMIIGALKDTLDWATHVDLDTVRIYGDVRRYDVPLFHAPDTCSFIYLRSGAYLQNILSQSNLFVDDLSIDLTTCARPRHPWVEQFGPRAMTLHWDGMGGSQFLVSLYWDTTAYHQYASSESLTLSGFPQGVDYTLVVSALCLDGDTLASPDTLRFMLEPLYCDTVTGLTLTPVGGDVMATWSGTAPGYEVAWGDTAVWVNSNSCLLTGLPIGQDVEVSVRSRCDTGDASLWVRGVVRVGCDGAMPLPYVEDFEGYYPVSAGDIPSCWTAMQHNTALGTPTLAEGVGTGSSAGLRIARNSQVATPRLAAPGNRLRVKFLTRVSSTQAGSIRVGFTTALDGTGTEEWLYPHIFETQGVWVEYDVPFHSISSADTGYVFFVHSGNYERYIDSLVITRLSDCPTVENLVLSGASTSSSVGLAWSVPYGSPAGYEVLYGTTGFDPQYGGQTLQVADSQASVTGLTAGVNYDFYVRALCGADGYGEWVGPITAMPVSQYIMQPTGTDTLRDACGITIYDDGGPDGLNSSRCDSKLIVFPSEGHALRLWGSVHCHAFALKIYEGIGTDGLLLDSYSSPHSVSVISDIDTITLLTGGPVTIHFTTTGSGYDSYGYEIHTQCVPISCLGAAGLLSASSTSTTADLDWEAYGEPHHWLVEYGPEGFTPGQGTEVEAYEHPFTIAGLTHPFSGDFYVRSVCAPGDTSARSSVGQFQTRLAGPGSGCILDSLVSNSPGTNADAPLHNYYNYNQSQFAYYLQEERDICGIGFDYAGTIATTAKTNCTIYISPYNNTNHSVVFSNNSGWKGLDSATLVYQGPLNCQPGWNFFNFQTPYHHAGVNCLIVTIIDNSGAFDGPNREFHTYSCYGMAYTYYSDQRAPDPNNLSYMSTWGYQRGYVPSTIFMSLPPAGADTSCSVPMFTHSASPNWDSVELSWIGDGGQYEVVIGDGAPLLVDTNWVSLGGLMPETEYRVRLRQVCDSGRHSRWVEHRVTTAPVPPCYAPEGLRAELPDGARAMLSWQEEEAVRYELHLWSHVGDTVYSVDGNSLSLSGLASPVEYSAALRSVCIEGISFSPWGDTLLFVTDSCPMPTAVQVVGLTATTAALAWQGDAPGWTVRYGLGEMLAEMADSLVVSSPACTLEGLAPDTRYFVTLQSHCAPGWRSLHTPTITFRTGGIGVNEAVPEDGLRVYPNPARDRIYVETPFPSPVEIIDLQGRVVQRGRANDNLPLRIPAGTYFVKCGTQVRKLVVLGGL